MKKGILFFVSALAVLAACSNTGKQESSKQTNESQSSYYQVTLMTFLSQKMPHIALR